MKTRRISDVAKAYFAMRDMRIFMRYIPCNPSVTDAAYKLYTPASGFSASRKPCMVGFPDGEEELRITSLYFPSGLENKKMALLVTTTDNGPKLRRLHNISVTGIYLAQLMK
jgi:hypothetical protein